MKRLAEPNTDAEREVLMKLLTDEQAKEPPPLIERKKKSPAEGRAPTKTTEKTTTGTTATTTTTTTKQVRAANELWYPDHAVFDATKDQLKVMPQFKYN
jgi:hypothetical protein